MNAATKTLVLSLLASLSWGCDTEAAPDIEPPYRGMIMDGDRATRVIINGTDVAGRELGWGWAEPVVVRAGVPFEVTTFLLGSPSCERPAPSVITYEAARVVLDTRMVGFGRICAQILAGQPGTDRVTFTAPGSAQVVVRGVQLFDLVGPDAQPRESAPDVDMRFPVLVVE